MQYRTIDLHMHTSVSDGTDSPEEIVARVCDAGIGLFSITDHDAVKAALAVPPLLRAGGPDFITGAEFSCRDELGKYHVLGYGYDPDSPAIRRLVETGHGFRMSKLTARLEFLKDEFGFDFPGDEVKKLLALDNPGKPHIANLMVRLGYVETKEQAFAEYLNKKSFNDQHVSPEMAIRLIAEGGGIPVLAHPAYGDGDQIILGEEMEERINRLVGFGLRGLEAFYSGFTPKIRARMLDLADRFGLFVTAGSDYHGKNKLVILADTGLTPDTPVPAGMEQFLSTVNIIKGK